MRFKLDDVSIRKALDERLSAHEPVFTSEQINTWFTTPFAITMLNMSYEAATAIATSRDTQTHISWFSLYFKESTIKHLWALRECILARSLLEAAHTMTDLPVYANILGSTTLLSDIDVTIESRQSSRVIEFIENLWADLKWFNHELWRVDLYGDFTMIGDFYMNMYKLDGPTKRELLYMAVVSYLRHHGASTFDKTILIRLIQLVTPEINSSEVLAVAETLLTTIDSLDKETYRQTYYKQLRAAELLYDEIFASISSAIDPTTLVNMVGLVLIHLARANLYREENYVLPSTVVHIVRLEQGMVTSVDSGEYDETCGKILTKIARCSLDRFAYLLSAIEQLGYMQANLQSETCTLSAGKYFGRFVRALEAANVSVSSEIRVIVAALASEKKERGERGNTDTRCSTEYDLYGLVSSITLFTTGGKRSDRSSSGRRRNRTKKNVRQSRFQ